jgi:hypothetical protein
MTTFTSAIYKWLRAEPLMPATVKIWKADLAEPADRIVSFATELHSDVERLLRSMAVSFGPDETETQLLLNIVDLVLSHVVWSRIAGQLLKDFGTAEPTGYTFAPPTLAPSAN